MMSDIDPVQIALQFICLLFSLCVHEAAHAAMANFRGDPSARLLGRLTLDPLKHIDPLGTVVFPLISMIFGVPYMFGWAKPVPFNPRNLKNVRLDPVWIAIAGPISNLLIALASAIILRIIILVLGLNSVDEFFAHPLAIVFLTLIMINVALAVFNLIPVPPLDGHYVLHFFLPPAGQRVLEQIGPFGIIIALVIVNQTGLVRVPMQILSNGILQLVMWGNFVPPAV